MAPRLGWVGWPGTTRVNDEIEKQKMGMLTTLNTFTHFSPKTAISHSLSRSLRRARKKFHFFPRIVACRAMDSPEQRQQGLSASLLDSVTQDLNNHTIHTHKSKLEDLNWDNSFVRELPSDPRTDPFPREVSFPSHFFHIFILIFNAGYVEFKRN